MKIYSVKNYENSNLLSYKGTVKPTDLYKNCAKEYARNISVSDDAWSKIHLFINTIRALRNDGSKNEFILDTIMTPKGKLWYIKYGDYCNQDEFFDTDIYIGKSYGRECLEEDAFRKVIQFGKEYFGLEMINKPIEEFNQVKKYLKRANLLIAKSRTEKDKDTARKLVEKSDKERQKANIEIEDIKTVLFNLL